MKSKVKEFILKNSLIRPGERVLCALSGGSDSVAMTALLAELSEELGFSVCAAHFNHKIRGAEADRDQAFSEALCHRLGIDIYTGSADIPSLATQNKEGLEECARKNRYAFLAECAMKSGASSVATAHHAADNTETVLFHLSRGSGIGGLGGIAPRRLFPDADGTITLIRPMLPCSKDELVSFIEERGLGYVTDSTNSDTAASRNYLRAKVVPELKKLNPSLDASVLNLSEAARCDEEYLSSLAERLPPDAGISRLRDLPEPILRRYVRLTYLRGHPKGSQLEYRHVREICDAIRGGVSRFRFSLPGGVAMIADGERLYIEAERREPPRGYTLTLSEPGEYETPQGLILLTRDHAQLLEWLSVHTDAVTCACRLGDGTIYARSQQSGDAYIRGGHTRAVRKELNRIRLPARKRPLLPRFCDEGGIFWVPHLPPADRVSTVAAANKIKQLIYIGYTEN